MIQPKKKLCDGLCGEERVIWKNYQGKRYCKQCWSCHEGNVKQKPTVKQTPLPLRSAKRSKEERIYSLKRLVYLTEHPMCEPHLSGCTQTSTEIHHKRGKIGADLIDETMFLAVCRNCHDFIENNRSWAIEQGFSIKRIN